MLFPWPGESVVHANSVLRRRRMPSWAAAIDSDEVLGRTGPLPVRVCAPPYEYFRRALNVQPTSRLLLKVRRAHGGTAVAE